MKIITGFKGQKIMMNFCGAVWHCKGAQFESMNAALLHAIGENK